MDRRELLALARSVEQVDVLIETATRLGCWPDDIAVESAEDSLDAVIGQRKGRPKHVAVDVGGRVSTRLGRT